MVSAIIPTRNRPALLAKAVRSVLAQTTPIAECIVVIDGQDNRTAEMLSTMGDARIRAIHLRDRVGGSEARNVGIRAAQGDWIALLDDDDEWLPEKTERQQKEARYMDKRFPVIGAMHIARTPTVDLFRPTWFPNENTHISEYLFCTRGLRRGCGSMQTSGIMALKSLFEKVEFKTGLKKHQDYDWLLRANCVEGVAFRVVPEPLTIWNVEDNRESVSRVEDWRFSLDWARSVRNLMTSKAYAHFIVTQCLRSAMNQQESWYVFEQLLRESLGSSMDIRCLSSAIVYGLFPMRLRRRLRNFIVALERRR